MIIRGTMKQQYLPSELEGAKYYIPTGQGAEKI